MSSAGRPEDSRVQSWQENVAPSGRWPRLQLAQIWRHRELAWYFAVRDVRVRYKQAYIGVAWAGLQPIAGAFAFTLVFHRLAKIDVGERSYFAFALVGFAVWNYFSTTVSSGSNSLLYNASLLTKVAFPRVLIPVAALLPGLIDLALGSALAIGAAAVAGDPLSLRASLITVPLGMVMLVMVTTGLVLFFSASIVRYRDVAVVLGFGLQVVLFASPVAYPPSLVPSSWRTLLYANPLAGSLGLLRQGFIGTPSPSVARVGLSALVAVIVLLGGLLHFRRRELEFADII